MARKQPLNELETVRIQPMVLKRVADRLDVLASDLGWTRNEVAAWLLGFATSDTEWLVNRFASVVRGKLRGKGISGVADGEA